MWSWAVKRNMMAARGLGIFFGFVLFLGTLTSEGKWHGSEYWAHPHGLNTEHINLSFCLSCACIKSVIQEALKDLWLKKKKKKSLHVQDKSCTHALINNLVCINGVKIQHICEHIWLLQTKSFVFPRANLVLLILLTGACLMIDHGWCNMPEGQKINK